MKTSSNIDVIKGNIDIHGWKTQIGCLDFSSKPIFSSLKYNANSYESSPWAGLNLIEPLLSQLKNPMHGGRSHKMKDEKFLKTILTIFKQAPNICASFQDNYTIVRT